MTKQSKILTVILSALFALSAFTALTVHAENEGGDIGGGSSYGDVGGDSPGGDNNGGSGGDQQQDNNDYNDDSYNSGGNDRNQYDDDDDSDYNYNNQNQYNRNDYSDDDDDYSDYNYEGERSASGEVLYVGGDQTYVPPETIPSTTAALYDTSKIKVDENTLSKNDWADIKNKLTASAKAAEDPDMGDFAFIQKNTSVEDNGHWMLILGFTLICLGLIGFIFLIIKANERRKLMAVSGGSRPATAEKPAPTATGSKASSKRAPRYRDDADDSGSKSAKSGTRFK